MSPGPGDPADRRLLLVEDADSDAQRVETMLAQVHDGGCRITRARDAAGACETLAAGAFDLVVLDLTLPDSTGPSTVRRVADAAGEVPIVVLTGTDDEDVGLACIEAGAQDYLPKTELRIPLLGRVIGYAIARAQEATERRRLEQELHELSERERRRIAHDLHDGLGQQLTGIAILARSLAARLAEQRRPEAEEANELGALVESTVAQSVALAQGLDPLTECGQGLQSALEGLASGSERRFQIRCRIRTQGDAHRVSGPVATHLHAIAREALSNAVEHGRAGTVDIDLVEVDGALELVVGDDGRGVPDPARIERGPGLRVMEHRARTIGAALTVERQPESSGLRVRCRLPAAD